MLDSLSDFSNYIKSYVGFYFLKSISVSAPISPLKRLIFSTPLSSIIATFLYLIFRPRALYFCLDRSNSSNFVFDHSSSAIKLFCLPFEYHSIYPPIISLLYRFFRHIYFFIELISLTSNSYDRTLASEYYIGFLSSFSFCNTNSVKIWICDDIYPFAFGFLTSFKVHSQRVFSTLFLYPRSTAFTFRRIDFIIPLLDQIYHSQLDDPSVSTHSYFRSSDFQYHQYPNFISKIREPFDSTLNALSNKIDLNIVFLLSSNYDETFSGHQSIIKRFGCITSSVLNSLSHLSNTSCISIVIHPSAYTTIYAKSLLLSLSPAIRVFSSTFDSLASPADLYISGNSSAIFFPILSGIPVFYLPYLDWYSDCYSIASSGLAFSTEDLNFIFKSNTILSPLANFQFS